MKHAAVPIFWRLVCGCVLLSGAALGQDIAVYSSSEDGDRLTRKDDIQFTTFQSTPLPVITIDEETLYQKMDGFGATFNEAGMICLNALTTAARDDVLEQLFDPAAGAGFTLMKAPIGSCDFTSAGPWHSYAPTPGDTDMVGFSIKRDLRRNGMITFINQAARFGAFQIEATMDFAPDWMYYGIKPGEKHIRPEYHDALAKYYVEYIRAYADHGITINYLNLFNEPNQSWYSNVTWSDLAHLIKDHVAPLLAAEELTTKIQLGETSDRSEGLAVFPGILADEDVRQHISGMTVHGYRWSDIESVAELHEQFPDIPIWMTEVCYASILGHWWCPVYEFSDGAFWGNMIMDDVNCGVSGWIYWNMILDQNGGPWEVSEAHSNPPYNSQHPVVIIDRKTKEVTYTGLYYHLAHFSKFVRPEAHRIYWESTTALLNCAAFLNADGSIALVVINDGDAKDVVVSWSGSGVTLQLKADSITTLTWDASTGAGSEFVTESE